MRSRAGHVILILLIVGTIVAVVSALLWRQRVREATWYTDGESIRIPIDGAPLRDVLWRPPRPLSESINTRGVDEYEPRLTIDGQTLYFVRGKAGANADIYVCERTASGWSDPAPLDAVNTTDDELGPQPAPDGQGIYFYSNRPGGHGGYDLWVIRRGENGEWRAAENLGGEVNSPLNDYGPAITPDGAFLYFSSNRPQPGDEDEPDPYAWPATVREDFFARDYDLYRAPITAGGIGRPEPVADLNSAAHEGAPAISPVGDFLYFASNRSGSLGGFDLYRARLRADDATHWPPENLGAPINTAANELDPALDMEGFALHFSADRAVDRLGETTATLERDYNLYRTTSREVYRELDRTAAALDWAAAWDAIWPWLLLLLLLLLLIWLLSMLRRLLSDERWQTRWRRLSLLAKCIMLSLLAHAVLMMLLAAWQVAPYVGDFLKSRGDGRRVTLVSSAMAGEIARQIRGERTDIEVEPPPAITSEAPAALSDPQFAFTPTLVEFDPALRTDPLIEPMSYSRVEPRLSEAREPEFDSVDPENVRDPSIAIASKLEVAPPESPAAAVAVRESAPEAQLELKSIAAPVVSDETALRHSDMTQALDAIELVEFAPAPSSDAPLALEDASRILDVPILTRLAEPATSDAANLIPSSATTAAPPRTAPVAEVAVAAPSSEAAAAENAIAEPPAPGVDIAAAAVAPPTSALRAQPVIAAAAPAESTPDLVTIDPAPSSPSPKLFAPSESANPLSSLVTLRESDAVHERDAPDSLASEFAQTIPRSMPTVEVGAALPDSSSPAPRHEESGAPAAVADAIREINSPDRASLHAPAPGRLASSPPDDFQLNPVSSTGPPEAPFEAPTINLELAGVAESAGATPFADSLSQAQAPIEAVRAPELALPSSAAISPSPPDEPFAPHDREPRLTLDHPVLATFDATSRYSHVPTSRKEIDTRVIELDVTEDVAALRAVIDSDEVNRSGEMSRQTNLPLPELSLATREGFTSEYRSSSSPPPPLPRSVLTSGSPDDEIVAALNLRIPSETVAPDGLYPQRAPERREALVEQGGGDERTEAAVARALEWFAIHQSDDGRWSGRRFDDGCGRCDSPAKFEFDRAMTGLALLCFLGADHTHTKPGPYQDAVKRGLEWLVQSQGEDGDLRQGETMYSHGIATIALAEAYGMTNDRELFEPLARAVNFIAAARHPSSDGWRYDPRQPGDTSVLGWQIMAAESARRSGVPVPAEIFESAGRWLDRASSARRPGLYAYQPGQPPTPSMTAEGMFVQQLLGFERDDHRMRESAAYLLDHLPGQAAGDGDRRRSDEDEAPTYYWYYATLALYQHGGEAWVDWNSALVPRLLDRQRSGSGPVAGSWDPEDEWADIGGRVYETAMCTLMLEIYYRYLPVYIDGDRRAARAGSDGDR